MATNVTEKDKTLNEIIDWAKSRCHEARLSRFDVRRKSDRDFYDGQVNAFHEMLELCRSMLGYSGSMPSCLNYEDIDDSSPDLQPQVGDYGEGWKILRVDIMPPTELSNNAVTATNVYILEREANDD